jgi:hypothetical protein
VSLLTGAKLGRIEKVVCETIRDCKKLDQKSELTEKGKGQLILAKQIHEILNE